jgi:signal transduction histidine kinase
MIAAASPAQVGLQWREPRVTRSSRAAQELAQGLARELHDSVAQTLTTMLITMEHFKLDQHGRQGVIEQVNALQQDTRDVLGNIRELLHELRGESGETLDFVDSLRQGPIRAFEQMAGFRVQLVVSDTWPRRLRSQAARHLVRIVQEALNNILFHSGARAVTVALEAAEVGGRLSVEVQDDGRGLPEQAGSLGAGMGLLGMRERVTILGGELQIESQKDRGTTLRVVLPMEACS